MYSFINTSNFKTIVIEKKYKKERAKTLSLFPVLLLKSQNI